VRSRAFCETSSAQRALIDAWFSTRTHSKLEGSPGGPHGVTSWRLNMQQRNRHDPSRKTGLRTLTTCAAVGYCDGGCPAQSKGLERSACRANQATLTTIAGRLALTPRPKTQSRRSRRSGLIERASLRQSADSLNCKATSRDSNIARHIRRSDGGNSNIPQGSEQRVERCTGRARLKRETTIRRRALYGGQRRATAHFQA
jgi:hypothetical protein